MQQDRTDHGQIATGGDDLWRPSLMSAAVLKPVSFSPAHASVDDYQLLTSTIRSRAEDAQGFFGGASRRPGEMAYLPLRIQLRSSSIELYIELRLQDARMRIVGFRNTFENGQAPPEACVRHVRDSVVPPGIRRAEVLPFAGGRSDLETVAAVRRLGIFLGRRPLGNAVVSLHRNCDPKCTAHGMLVLSEMICEAARYPALADAMSRIWMTGGRLSAAAPG
ncbi:ribosome-inactivating family protein [Streptomyces sp. BR123]|uniref:ribosome-inactivating family protein n=1 Tax=Streptomyces sp. BR123 TaxID=2749828 RepID=UPI00211B62C1|nr:ribosome-inactivating family protein [Streptomyces sp. BR123]